MLTEVRICGRKLFHHDVWRVRINGHKWLYDKNNDCFMEKHGMGDYGKAVAEKDMPIDVRLGFALAWDKSNYLLYRKYSDRRSRGWKLMLDNLYKMGRTIVVASHGRRMGMMELVLSGEPLKDVPVLSEPAVCDRHQ